MSLAIASYDDNDRDPNEKSSNIPRTRITINLDDQPAESAATLALALHDRGTVFSVSDYRGGLVINARSKAYRIDKPDELAPLIADELEVTVYKGPKFKGTTVPNSLLKILLKCEAFTGHFNVVDTISDFRSFNHKFELEQPGYNPGPQDFRKLLTGEHDPIANSLDYTNRFLDQMDFKQNADRTAAVAGALTVVLGNHWPGGKPLLLFQASKSQSGKDTVADFAAGMAQKVALSFQHNVDWPMEKNVAQHCLTQPNLGVIAFENVRSPGKNRVISSTFLERIITTKNPVLHTTGTGNKSPVRNKYIFMMTTNEGELSEDLLNRALPCYLEPQGDVSERTSTIGDPRWDYLPNHQELIHLELLGMIQKWVQEGRPLLGDVPHTFKDWGKTIGGILEVNGFTDFLGNYRVQRIINDPVRELLACLGMESPNEWLRTEEWLQLAEKVSLADKLIPGGHQANIGLRLTGLGKTLKNHANEKLVHVTEDEHITLQLCRERRRFEAGREAEVRCCFEILDRQPIDD